MVDISQQSKKLKARTLAKWFNIMLDDSDQKVQFKSSLRNAPVTEQDVDMFDEDQINKSMNSFQTFIKRRKINRTRLIDKEIKK